MRPVRLEAHPKAHCSVTQGCASWSARLPCVALALAQLLALLLVAACPATAEPWLWGAAGDSLTRRNPFTYPTLLADGNHQMHNVALGGSRVWDFIDEQVPRILRLGCTVVTVSIGTNDVMQASRVASPRSCWARFE